MTSLLLFLPLASAFAGPEDPGAAPSEDLDPQSMAREIRELRSQLDELKAEHSQAEEAGRVHRVTFTDAILIPTGQQVDEAVAFGNDVHVDGHVLGNAVAFGGDVSVSHSGRVDGDLVSFGGSIDVEDGAQIGGNRVAMELPMSLPVVAEAIEPTGAASLHLATDAGALLHTLYRRMVFLLSVAGAGVLVVGLFPARVSRVAQDIEERPIRAAVVGTLSTGFLMLFAGLFTVVTLGLGLPVSVLLVGLLGIAWLLGFVALCQAIGDRLPLQDRPHGRWIALLLGVVLLTFLGSLPWIGWLTVGMVSLLGIGSALATRFGRA